MNFDSDLEFFRNDVKNALQDVCNKYQIKLKDSFITYYNVDFELKLKFEKNESGINTERIMFEEECGYYGFTPDDYLKVFMCDGDEYEFIGFDRKARKYKCVARNIDTMEKMRFTERYMHKLLDSENIKTSNESVQINEFSNLITPEELAILNIKLQKNKRNEKDWTQIKNILLSRNLITFRTARNIPCASAIGGIALEEGYFMVFTSLESYNAHIKWRMPLENMRAQIIPTAVSLEYIITTARKERINVLFDAFYDMKRKYYMYDVEDGEIKAVMLE